MLRKVHEVNEEPRWDCEFSVVWEPTVGGQTGRADLPFNATHFHNSMAEILKASFWRQLLSLCNNEQFFLS